MPGREVQEYMREHETSGSTVVLLAVGTVVAAALAVKDPVKPEAAGVIAALNALGLQVSEANHGLGFLAIIDRVL